MPTGMVATTSAAEAGSDPASTEATSVPPHNNDPATAVRRPRRIPVFI